MSRIVVLDDDYASELLIEHLVFLGHEVTRYSSAALAMENIESIAACDLLILDIIMEAPPTAVGSGVSGGRTAGMVVFGETRRRNPKLPVLAYTATSDPDIVDLLSRSLNTTYLAKWNTPSLADLGSTVQRILGLEEPELPRRPFIVHGQDDATKLAVKNFLQNGLHLPEPIILHEQPNLGRTILEKFEHYSSDVPLAFVILTPDDKIAAPGASNEEKRRARQNVIFELGYFLAKLGRHSGRVILLYKGPLEIPSDLSGLVYVDIGQGIEAAGELIRRELKDVLN